MTNATVLLVCHDLVFFPFNGVGGLFEALPQFGISRDQNAYKYEHGCLAFHTLVTVAPFDQPPAGLQLFAKKISLRA
jgi:hypothetical protein